MLYLSVSINSCPTHLGAPDRVTSKRDNTSNNCIACSSAFIGHILLDQRNRLGMVHDRLAALWRTLSSAQRRYIKGCVR